MSSFRELFDEQEREDILLAMQARLSQLEARLKKAQHTEQATNVVTVERLGTHINRTLGIIATLVEESN
jgi:hypothetical protein